ncbi:MAG TPA: ABC transporter permease [Burkholderiaceae bacterium]|nr:ABC transporter permease [Burkholderiaceae bacterium]
MSLVLDSHLDALYRFRGFIAGSVRREFASRYRNSLLGAAWLVLQPLSTIAVFTLVFSQVMKARLGQSENPFAYSIHLCAGMLTWALFAEIVGRGMNVFIDHANLLKKLNFPRICLPAIVVINACLGFAIVFALFTLFLLATGNFPGWRFVLVVPPLIVEVLFAIGLGMILGVLNVFFRDVGQFFSIALQFWFWLTPIVYTLDTLPEAVARVVAWNPMTPLVASYQRVLLRTGEPAWTAVAVVGVLAAGLCAVGLRLFQRRSAEMVDEL